MDDFYRLLVFLLIALLVFSCSPPRVVNHAGTTEKTGREEFNSSFKVPEFDANYYEDCPKRFESRNPDSIISTDLIKFRYSYLAYKDKTGKYVPVELEKEFGFAVKEKDFKKVEKLADTILEIDFTDMRVHMMKAYAMKLEGKNFKFHKTMVELLENSIFITGDGKSPITEPMKSLAKMFK